MRASLVGSTVLAAVAAAVVLPVGAVSAATDSEAPKISTVAAPAIVGLTSTGAVFDITVRASDNIDIAQVVVGVMDSAGHGMGFPAKLVSGMSWDGLYKARVTLPVTTPGTYNVLAYADDNTGNRSVGVSTVRDTFVLKWTTKIAKLNADPEPVRRGQKLTVTGLLKQAGPQGWSPLTGKSVKIQFRKAGTTGWLNLHSATSNAKGRFTYATTSTGAGEWRAVYKGDATRMKSISNIDAVTLAH